MKLVQSISLLDLKKVVTPSLAVKWLTYFIFPCYACWPSFVAPTFPEIVTFDIFKNHMTMAPPSLARSVNQKIGSQENLLFQSGANIVSK